MAISHKSGVTGGIRVHALISILTKSMNRAILENPIWLSLVEITHLMTMGALSAHSIPTTSAVLSALKSLEEHELLFSRELSPDPESSAKRKKKQWQLTEAGTFLALVELQKHFCIANSVYAEKYSAPYQFDITEEYATQIMEEAFSTGKKASLYQSPEALITKQNPTGVQEPLHVGTVGQSYALSKLSLGNTNESYKPAYN